MSKGKKRRLTIIQGRQYDVTDFVHPGGSHMLDLAVGRDATILFESLHVRNKSLVAATLKRLPQVSGLCCELETWATPEQGALYNRICERVQTEILKPLVDIRVPNSHIASVFFGWIASAVWYVCWPSMASGCMLGLTLCWVGLAIQHSANHGGLTKRPAWDYLFGLLNDVVPGGSSLIWRFHHQVSHHTYCNDAVLDQDVHSSFPLIRLDALQPWAPFHRYQWLYAPFLFSLLHLSIQSTDLHSLWNKRTHSVQLAGVRNAEVVLAVMLKLVHISWFVVLPVTLHGAWAMVLPMLCAMAFGSFCLSFVFIISHNVIDAKNVDTSIQRSDWARYQIETSSSWGGSIGSFFTGGLNFQIEHHLFPSLPHHLYQDIQPIVQEECAARGIPYNYYPSLLHNVADNIKFLYILGQDRKSK